MFMWRGLGALRKPKDMEASVRRNAAALKIQVSYTLANRLRSCEAFILTPRPNREAIPVFSCRECSYPSLELVGSGVQTPTCGVCQPR